MSNTLKFGNGEWYGKEGTILAYNDENNNYKPLPFTFDRDSVATRVNKQGLIETVGADQPRVDYKDSTDGAMLLEPSRTNVIINSENFTGSEWVLFGFASGDAPILTSNYATSPDGKQNATRLQFNLNGGTTTTDRSYIRYNSFASQTDYYYSCYVKSANGQEQKLLWQHGGDDNEFTVTNEWQRVELDRNGNAETFAGFSLRGGISTVDSADVLIWGFQVEQGSYATSLINTSGSAVTRLADACNNSGNDQVINSTEGVLYAEVATLADVDTFDRIISLSDNSTTNRVEIKLHKSGSIEGRFDSVNSDITLNKVGLTVSNFNKIALVWSSGKCALFINGVKEQEDLTFITFASNVLFDLSFNSSYSDADGNRKFYGNVKDVRVYNTELTDQEAIALTT